MKKRPDIEVSVSQAESTRHHSSTHWCGLVRPDMIMIFAISERALPFARPLEPTLS